MCPSNGRESILESSEATSAKNQFLKSTVTLTGQQIETPEDLFLAVASSMVDAWCTPRQGFKRSFLCRAQSRKHMLQLQPSWMPFSFRVILCWILQVRILMYLYLDSSAARGVLSRRRVGRLRHLSCRILWLQNLVNEKLRKCCKSKPFLAQSIQLTFPRNVSASAGWKVSYFFVESGVARALS